MATQQVVELQLWLAAPCCHAGREGERRDGVLQHGLRRHMVSQSE